MKRKENNHKRKSNEYNKIFTFRSYEKIIIKIYVERLKQKQKNKNKLCLNKKKMSSLNQSINSFDVSFFFS